MRDIVQVYAIQDCSLAVRHKNKILIWGDRKSHVFGKMKKSDAKEEISANGFYEKPDFTDIINSTMLKENNDITEEYINSRKLFDIKYNMVKEDNAKKERLINQLESQRHDLTEEIKTKIEEVI